MTVVKMLRVFEDEGPNTYLITMPYGDDDLREPILSVPVKG